MMLNTGSATAQSSITQSNLQAVQTDDPVTEDLQKMGKLFSEFYDTFKEGRKRRQIVRKTPTDFIRKTEDQFKDLKINNKPRNTYFSTSTVKSEGFSKLKEFVVARTSAVTGMVTATGGKDFTKETLKIMGSAHLTGAALLVVVVLLERWEMFSVNKEELLDLLENMADLVSFLYQIRQRSTEISQMGDCHLQEIIRECMDSIMDGYDFIWSTLTATKTKRFFKSKTEKEELAKLEHQLDNKHRKLVGQIVIDLSSFFPYTRPHDFRSPQEAVRANMEGQNTPLTILDLTMEGQEPQVSPMIEIECQDKPKQIDRSIPGLQMPKRLKDQARVAQKAKSEGIDDAVAEVMGLRDCDSEERVVAVTAYGIGVFQDLADDYVEAFNDICFFLGMDKVSWIEMQSTYGDDVMEILQNRALICKSYAVASEALAYVKVLDVIVEAAKKRAKGRRLDNLEELKEMLHKPDEIVRQEMLKSVKIIWFPEENDMELSAKDVDLMSPSLRTFSCWRPIIGKCEETFKQLLHWRALNVVPFDFKQTPRLKCLQFRPSGVVDLSKMPPSIASLKIDLRMISKADADRDEVDTIRFSSDEGSSILPNLKILELANSESPRLPKGLLCRLTSLTVLLIKSMDELVKLPDEFQFLPCLTSLVVFNCPKLKEISNSIGSCPSLDSLLFKKFDELESLPEQLFDHLSLLTAFFLVDCPKVKRIPNSLIKCTALRQVGFSRNRRIKKLPRNFECLPSLQRVSIIKCKRMEGGCLDILLKMKTLKEIKISGSPKLIERWNEVKEGGMQKMKGIVITE